MPSTDELTRRQFLRGMVGVAGALTSPRLGALVPSWRSGAIRTFGVLSLFSPQQLILEADEALILQFDGEARTLPFGMAARFRAVEGDRIEAVLQGEKFVALRIEAASTSGDAATFSLSIPPPALHGVIQRRFTGRLSVTDASRCLRPVVAMECEEAVACVVLAESPPGAVGGFLRAQAIAARSFLLGAQAGHRDYDFCDTTHCQFLRQRPGAQTPAGRAVRETHGQVLSAGGVVLPAMYSRSCGGHTSTLAELHLHSDSYPYYSVRCDYCSARPERWDRPASAGRFHNWEKSRIAYNSNYGWAALPSNKWRLAQGVLQGSGIGHGVGMCQLGAAAMAHRGSSHEEILSHYYPNTAICDAGLTS